MDYFELFPRQWWSTIDFVTNCGFAIANDKSEVIQFLMYGYRLLLNN